MVHRECRISFFKTVATNQYFKQKLKKQTIGTKSYRDNQLSNFEWMTIYFRAKTAVNQTTEEIF